jgi:hypothetical protein
LTGYTEVRYDAEKKRVVVEPLELTQGTPFHDPTHPLPSATSTHLRLGNPLAKAERSPQIPSNFLPRRPNPRKTRPRNRIAQGKLNVYLKSFTVYTPYYKLNPTTMLPTSRTFILPMAVLTSFPTRIIHSRSSSVRGRGEGGRNGEGGLIVLTSC